MSETLSSDPVVIVGAGPYGLSVGAHLRHRGIPIRIFGEPMDSWRHHVPIGMGLKSLSTASDIAAPEPGHTLADYCRLHAVPAQTHQTPVPSELFTDYGLWFQRTLVPEVEQVQVTMIARNGVGFHVELTTGERVSASAVILATGLGAHTHLPAELSGAPGRVTHSWQHRDSKAYAGADVIVVGAGQSALQGAILLHEAGARVRVLSRAKPEFAAKPRFVGESEHSSIFSPYTTMGNGYLLLALESFPSAFRHLPKTTRLRAIKHLLGPSGSWWLRDRAVGHFEMRSGVRVLDSAPAGDGVALSVATGSDMSETITADHVIAATGYRVDVDRIMILAPEIRTAIRRVGTWPALNKSFETSVPGLFVIGPPAAVSFGPMVRFVCGTSVAARRVARAFTGQPTRSPAPART